MQSNMLKRKVVYTGKRAVEIAKAISFEGIREKNQWRTNFFRVPGLRRGQFPFFVGDKVGCVDGLWRGRVGIIKDLDFKTGKVCVEGVNIKTEMKTKFIGNEEVERLETTEHPIPAHFVKLIDPTDNRTTEVEFRAGLRFSQRTMTQIPFPSKPKNPLYPDAEQEIGPFDTFPVNAQEKTFSLEDPWQPPFPISLTR